MPDGEYAVRLFLFTVRYIVYYIIYAADVQSAIAKPAAFSPMLRRCGRRYALARRRRSQRTVSATVRAMSRGKKPSSAVALSCEKRSLLCSVSME